jgi:hypothetical protein
MKVNKVALKMEVNVSVKPMQQDAELQYYDINI